jgi:hypothetical protein
MKGTLAPPEGRANAADILLIGAQRAMTTWAHRLAVLHPRAWAFPDFSPLTAFDKEAQFWTRNRARGPDWYRVLMTPPERRDRLSLDFSPDYATLGAAQIAECRALSPTARVVYILRDPLARALSALRMHTMWETGNAPPEAIRLYPDAETLARAERARLWVHADYAGNAARWRAAYPDLTVLNAEDLAADPLAGAARLLRAMGLDPAELAPPAAATLAQRARERVWQTPRYGAQPDLIAWLHGATWAHRRAAEAAFGFVFHEFEGILRNPDSPDSP